MTPISKVCFRISLDTVKMWDKKRQRKEVDKAYKVGLMSKKQYAYALKYLRLENVKV